MPDKPYPRRCCECGAVCGDVLFSNVTDYQISQALGTINAH